jgi:hypothetical protein
MGWGNVAEWVAATATVLGFGGAIAQLRLSRSDSIRARGQEEQDELDRREAMARAVGVKSSWQPDERGRPPTDQDGLMPVQVEVLNSGPYPISSAVLELASDDENLPMSVVYGTILPGEHLKDTHLVRRTEVVFGELTGGATLVFTDTYGQHWSSSTSWRGLERRDQPARIC